MRWALLQTSLVVLREGWTPVMYWGRGLTTATVAEVTFFQLERPFRIIHCPMAVVCCCAVGSFSTAPTS